MSVRILLVDDHEVILEGIRGLVERSGHDWEVCGMARNGKEGVEMNRTLKPDVVVLDISMPVMNGLEAAKAIAKAENKARVLLFTMHESDRMESEARAVGARGYVVKSQAARNLIRAIESILDDDTFFAASAASKTPEKQPEQENPSHGSTYFSLLSKFGRRPI